MSAKTSIEWTEATWNPVRGCSRVSEGCRNCYAERQAARFAGTGGPFEGFVAPGKNLWTGKVELVEKHLADPLKWREPRRIFVNSMSDLWHEQLCADDQAAVYGIMAEAYWHTFQVLTKRPERRLDQFRDQVFSREVYKRTGRDERFSWPLPNVWEGVSVEDQRTADERIPLLMQTPAAVRFVSYEPALGPVEFGRFPLGTLDGGENPGIDWIIAGGESGPGARPPHPQWFRDVRDQCQAARVAFFFKQCGEWLPEDHMNESHPWFSTDYSVLGPRVRLVEYERGPEVRALSMPAFRVGRRAAGRLLDGREWNEFPEVRP